VTLTPPPAIRGEAPQLPPELLRPGATFTLAQVVDIALANSPFTRTSYRQARSAAADLASKRGAYFPTVDASARALRARQPTNDQQGDVTLTAYGPALTLSYLLLDFGGRGGKVEEARQALLAADWSHNATLHNVALGVQQAYFQYLDVKALLEAARTTLAQAQASLDAANVRHDAGVATIADVLQAKTALAQAMLNSDGLEGQVLAVRGALATAMGLPANVPFDVGSLPSEVPLERARPAIDSLIETARLQRPDYAELRALASKAAAHVGTVRADGLPRLAFQGGVDRTYVDSGPLTAHHDTWSAGVQLSVPLFHGFSPTYDLRRAKEDAAAVRAQAEGYEQQVVLQVWTSYYALETATQRVRTSQALLESATQSEQVALARYKEGVGTVLDLLSAQAALANARAQEIQARSDWFVATARLAHDSGALMPSDAVAIVTEEKKDK
jgi:outer membrane protein TolC